MSITPQHLTRKNFDWKEFFTSDLAARLNIDNSTDDLALLFNAMILADKMQEIRDKLGKPIKINSAYRNLKLNRLIGSKDTSQHVKFQACDFVSDFGTPEEIVKFLKKEKMIVDQCLVEFSSWVHVSIKHKDNRNQFAYLDSKGFRLLTN